MNSRKLEHAIERVVRDLMHVDTDAGFRARVLARLGSEPVRGRARALRLAVTVAGLSVLFAWIFVTRSPEPRSVPQTIVTRDTSSQPAVPAPIRPAAPKAETTPARSASAEPRERSTSARAERTQEPNRLVVAATESPQLTAASVDETEAVEIVPLSPLEPIAMVSLEPEPIVREEIVIEPLTPIVAVQIQVLSSNSR